MICGRGLSRAVSETAGLPGVSRCSCAGFWWQTRQAHLHRQLCFRVDKQLSSGSWTRLARWASMTAVQTLKCPMQVCRCWRMPKNHRRDPFTCVKELCCICRVSVLPHRCSLSGSVQHPILENEGSNWWQKVTVFPVHTRCHSWVLALALTVLQKTYSHQWLGTRQNCTALYQYGAEGSPFMQPSFKSHSHTHPTAITLLKGTPWCTAVLHLLSHTPDTCPQHWG